MSVGKIAVRYAKALFLSAREQEVLDKVRMDMELLLEVSSGDNQVKRMLDSPIIDSSDKFRVLGAIFTDRINTLTLDFLHLVTSRNREEYLAGMCRHYIQLYKKEKGIMQARIGTAGRLTAALRKEIIEIVNRAFKAEIELEEEVNKDLIGGFVLTVEDKQLDASVKGTLNRIKKELRA